MKTVLLFIAIVFCAVSPAHALEQRFAYRNFIWGVSPDDVRKFETAVFYKEEGDSLYFLSQPDRFRRLIRYDFQDNKLVGIRFEVADYRESISTKVVNMFYTVERYLTEEYGAPKTEALWKNRRYEKHPAYWGRPLYSGDLHLRNTWVLPDALIEQHAYHDGGAFRLYYTMVKTDANPAPPANAIDLTVLVPTQTQAQAWPLVPKP